MTRSDVSATVLVIQPDPSDPLDRFEEWLEGLGIHLDLIRPYAGDRIPQTLASDGLIVLGGKMSSNDDADHPWLEDIRSLQRHAVDLGSPTLGICLGGQLLAQALGGKVVQGARGVEAGLVSVRTTGSVDGDLLFAGLGSEFSVASMHVDMIETLPEGAVLLASSDPYRHQAFRFAGCAWGVQFHPEISPATYAVWAGIFDSPDPAQMARVAEGVEVLAAGDSSVRQTSVLIATRFAQLVSRVARDATTSAALPELNRLIS